MSLAKEVRQELIAKYRRSEKDCGSPEVQVALTTTAIGKLSEHIKAHPHDFHSRRGLMQMVGKRRRLLSYIKREDEARYLQLVQRLELRK